MDCWEAHEIGEQLSTSLDSQAWASCYTAYRIEQSADFPESAGLQVSRSFGGKASVLDQRLERPQIGSLRVTALTRSPLKLLLFGSGWASLREERTPEYELLHDPICLPEAHAVIFHIPTAPDLRRIRKYPGQKWVAWSMESDVNYPMLRFGPFMAQFDLTMTYRLDSDVPMLYFGPRVRERLLDPPREKTAEAAAVYFASNSNDRGGRRKYIEELMKFLPVDSYGRSLRNRELLNDQGHETKIETIALYRFNLAFENSRTEDYVTEKFFEPLIAGCVPVYRGAPNVAQFAPGENCYIDAADFTSPRELAQYLNWLAGNPAEYQKYLAWKQRPLRQSFLDKLALTSSPPLSRLCSKLRAIGVDPGLSSA
jgi:hypothetical protein